MVRHKKTSLSYGSYAWFFTGLVIVCTMSQCELNDRIEYYAANKGFLEAEVNGESWRMDCAVPNEKNDSNEILMLGRFFNVTTQLYESIVISFFNIPRNDTVLLNGDLVNEYHQISISYCTLYQEGDVGYETYNLASGTANFFKLIVNGNYREIEGAFEFDLVKSLSSSKDESPMPDTLRFRKGIFENDLR